MTWNLWKEVRDWAVTRGYDLGGAGAGSGENHPVRNVNWYQAISWCNARSEKEGLTPVYELNGSVYRGGYGTVTLKSGASGYRLPTQTEWEWAARGGNESTGYQFSGGDDLGALGWYRGNSQGAEVGLEEGGVGTWPVGMKAPNELGLFDMSGNVYEWCWDASGTDRFIRGGSWWEQDLLHCSVTYSRVYGAGTSGADTGLRVVRKLAP